MNLFFSFVLGSLLTLQILACKINGICPVTTLLTRKENEQLQVKLLSMLGLPENPQNISSKKMKYSSKFLLDIYKILNNDKKEFNRVRRQSDFLFGLREDEVSKADISNVIVSLNSVNKKSDGVGKRQKLAFITKSLPESEGIFGAELKLYQHQKLAQNLPYFMYTISVYTPSSHESTKMKKVAEKITSVDFTGWLSIDISYMFNIWLKNLTSVKNLYVSVTPYGETDEMHPSAIGIVFQHENIENEPFIVAFLKAQIRARLPRDLILQSKRLELLNFLEGQNALCRLHSLRVSFKDLGWDEWVIAPDGYTTAFCQGTCNFPLKHPTNATSHAIIQELVRLKNPGKYPKPCCTPTKLSSLSVLYREKDNTILKKYKNMIATSCGCH